MKPVKLNCVTKAGCAGLRTNAGAHGFTEILFAYASAFANNGQSMAGLSVNNVFYNLTTIAAMLMGRYVLAVLALALAGRFAAASRRPSSRGTMPSDGITFGALLAGILLGVSEAFTAFFWGSEWAPALSIVLLLVILVLFPSGLSSLRRT